MQLPALPTLLLTLLSLTTLTTAFALPSLPQNSPFARLFNGFLIKRQSDGGTPSGTTGSGDGTTGVTPDDVSSNSVSSSVQATASSSGSGGGCEFISFCLLPLGFGSGLEGRGGEGREVVLVIFRALFLG